jgi:mycoredoxin
MTDSISAFTMYTTPWCGFCHRLKRQLAAEDVTYEEVNIELDPAAASIVEQVNQGNQTVPTLVFTDGTSVTNPSLNSVLIKLDELATIPR